MEKLFTPDFGLMAWTALTFLLLLAVLAKFGWRPILEAIETRERGLREERQAAEAARNESQRIQADLEAKLAGLDARTKEVLAAAHKEAEALRVRHTEEAREEARRLLDKTRAELEEEKRRLTAQLRRETAQLAVAAAERLVRKSVDEGVRKSALDQFFKELDEKGGGR